jgi:uncharacterized repeat protein (TIGR03803 family)
MRGKRFFIGSRAILTILAITLLEASTWAAPRERVLHSFNDNGKDGVNPYAGVIFDSSGNLYGTTAYGGCNVQYGCGTVFELTPTRSGTWEEKVLHHFNFRDGWIPFAGLIFGANGNLYGTTEADAGTVFELTPTAGGDWTEKVLHRFKENTKDGVNPYAGVIFDSSGNLYGTTLGGWGLGTVFELSPKEGGGWAERILHDFTNKGKEGNTPYAGVIFDTSGNLYGTTYYGGDYQCEYGCGTVFELTPKAGGGWAEKVLHSFNMKDGATPVAGLIFDASGNLYGTTSAGGGSNQCQYGCGTVFELTPKAGGGWTEKVLHSFGQGEDGAVPLSGLIFDASGNLYGTTYEGGTYGYGTVFEIIP